MPYPAYQGTTYYFDIVIGHAWDHEFAVIDRNDGEPMVFEDGWQASCVLRDNAGAALARLDNAVSSTADGTITLTTGVVALNLPGSFTATLPATTLYRPSGPKPFLWADITLIDPLNGEPYIFARGKGVSYLPTTIG
ncbi:hypothetical protein GUY44_07210 [Pimelobacter simplex]|uniref:Uncharacterized protein n=1 Tax=Nocardioides simplex TaxID=2045 RepID=A0A0A1DMB9_NOCSI|nr:hypothetical protein [Pimelobacter simplex]AIY17792.1 hypothetical protein KR76_15310 [Pimelobacter simplex]MCG8150261.1 hypothetical protein [Pimelobacter simplex]GEB13530.1 hypothetical protein NSI01_18450 [Pimelobacter simplex]SFM72190.1 hypothetical protein SAMN05421671_3141 [Pimelobacter simplex]